MSIARPLSRSLAAILTGSDCCGVSSRRANCIRKLFISDELLTGSLPAAVTAAVLGTQCSSLEVLRVHVAAVSLCGEDIAALAVLTRLTSLQVHHTILPLS